MTTTPPPRFATPTAAPEPGAMEMLDEAAALLRRTPFSDLSIYLLGSLPFWLGAIYFDFDMTQSTDAEVRLVPEAVALTVLYFWMKTCQAVFARKILALLEGGDPEPWTAARWLRTAQLQAIVSGSLPLVYTAALVATVPFAWVNAFYHNFAVVGTGATTTLGESVQESARLARLWPRQNHLMLATLWAGGFVLLLNLAVLLFALPQLLNSLLGIESVFDENTLALANSAFYLGLFVICYLLLNPLNKALFALRCFYGRSLTSGSDLRAGLRQCEKVATRSGLAAAVLFLLAIAPACAAPANVSPPAPAPVSPVEPAQLDRAIERTLQKDEFTWRLPRPEAAESHAGLFVRLGHRLEAALRSFWDWVKKPVERFFKWLLKEEKDKDDSGKSTLPDPFAAPWKLIIILLAVVALAGLGWLAVRRWQAGRPDRVALASTLLPARTVDLKDEALQADELPEDSWLTLAQQLMEQGELRLALRAFYLATLATLAGRELIRLAPAKSNRDYIAELVRRLRGDAEVVPFFRENVKLFEAAWYGTHDVDGGVIDAMRGNQQRIRNHVTA